MADPRRRLPENAPGDWFVDDTCMGCDASRQCAPGLIEERDGGSLVVKQPENDAEKIAMSRALLVCPTGSIGSGRASVQVDVFPQQLDEGVWLTGFNSPRAYGGNSFFVQRPEGNLLIDGPRFTKHLTKAFEQRGGVQHVLLTHQDDLGDAAEYAKAFGARVWIHEAEARSAPFATDLISGDSPVELQPGLLALPVPGHTRGSVMFEVQGRFLFTGDSLFWSRDLQTLHAHRAQCWFSWEAQTRSLATLKGRTFEWVLAGHGGRVHLPAAELQKRLDDLIRRMPMKDWRDAW